jgi:hypothetical protein
MLKTLWASRKFRIMVFDFIISAVFYFGSKYLGASVMDDVRWFLLGAQPILISLVLGIAIEDNGTNQAIVHLLPESITVPPSLTPTVVSVVPAAPGKLVPVAQPDPVTPPASMVQPAAAVPDTLPAPQ